MIFTSVARPKEESEESTEFQHYAQVMSSHHHKQYTSHQFAPSHTLSTHSGPSAEEYGLQAMSNADYYNFYENISPTIQPPPQAYPADMYYGEPNNASAAPSVGSGMNFTYMQQNNSNASNLSAGYFFSSASSSPKQEHARASISSLPSSLPSPYAKEGPDMFAARRNRARPRSFIQSRNSLTPGRPNRAFSSDSLGRPWQLPFDPQFAGQFGRHFSVTPDAETFLSYNHHDADDFVDPAEAHHRRSSAQPVTFYPNFRQSEHQHHKHVQAPHPLPKQLPQNQVQSAEEMDSPDSEDAYSPFGTREDESFDEKQRSKRSATCPICNKHLKRDLTRHLRTHEQTARFICPFPRSQCPHKRGQFNRPYDFKKHLLHHHFHFDKAKVVRKFRDLQSKLTCRGTCPCGQGNFIAAEWLNEHVLGGNVCPLVRSQMEGNADPDAHSPTGAL